MRNFIEELNRAIADVEMTPALRRRVYTCTIEGGKRKVKRKLPVVLVVALILLLVASIAYATGIGKTIFSELIDVFQGANGQKFEVADELSTSEETAFDLTVAPGMTLMFKQSYYDGAQLVVGYVLEGTPPAVDFDFDPTQYMNLSEIMDPYNAYAGDVTVQLPGEEEAATFNANYERDGKAGALIPRVYVTGGAVDGEDLSRRWTEVADGTSYYYPTLPDVALDKDFLEITYEVGVQYDYICRDGKDSYYVTLWDMYKIENVTLTVPRTTDATRSFAGTYSDDRYAGSATMYASPLSNRVSIHLDVPKSWLPGWKEAEKLAANGYDVPVGYVLVVDGAVYEGTLDQDWQDSKEGTRDWDYEFILEIHDDARVSLRPVYSISGQVADEDIPLTLQ